MILENMCLQVTFQQPFVLLCIGALYQKNLGEKMLLHLLSQDEFPWFITFEHTVF